MKSFGSGLTRSLLAGKNGGGGGANGTGGGINRHSEREKHLAARNADGKDIGSYYAKGVLAKQTAKKSEKG